MIKLLDVNKQSIGFLAEIGDYYIESVLETADKTIHFLLPQTSEYATNLQHGMYLKTATDEFIIKEINYSDYKYLEVFGKLNVEDLQGSVTKNYESVNKSIDEIMDGILSGTGWSWQYSNPVIKNRTIRKTNATAYDLVMEAVSVYGLEVEFDTINKIVKFYQAIGTNRGAYIYSDLNLKKCDYQSDIYDLVTVIYPYGAEGLTIADVNDGFEYVYNYNYTNKVIEKVWEDDRYTDPQSLKDDAIAMLENLAQPRVSFTVDVLDLASVTPDYGILDFRLGDSVKIIDKNNPFLEIVEEVNPTYITPTFNLTTFGSAPFLGYVDETTFVESSLVYGQMVYGGDVTQSPQIDETKYSNRIVKLTVYPLEPEKNKAEFSNVQITMKNMTRELNTAIEGVNNKIEVTRTNLDVAIENATALIKTENGGYVVKRYNAEDQPYELLIMDTPSIETADNVWRWNQNGLGFSSTGYNGTYGTAITKDGKIVADFITTGTLDASVIGASSITAEKLAVNSVTADKIASNSITSVKINADAITTDKIVANAITSTKISAGAITADKLNVTSLSAITANLGTVTAGTINGVTINSTTFTGGKITLEGAWGDSLGFLTIKDTSAGSSYQLQGRFIRAYNSDKSFSPFLLWNIDTTATMTLSNTDGNQTMITPGQVTTPALSLKFGGTSYLVTRDSSGYLRAL